MTTKELADVGCGLGGTSGRLSDTYGCRATGVDLTPAYCRTPEILTDKLKLSDQVNFRHADATDLPFDDMGFDIVRTENAAMNIPDKSVLYSNYIEC